MRVSSHASGADVGLQTVHADAGRARIGAIRETPNLRAPSIPVWSGACELARGAGRVDRRRESIALMQGVSYARR